MNEQLKKAAEIIRENKKRKSEEESAELEAARMALQAASTAEIVSAIETLTEEVTKLPDAIQKAVAEALRKT